MHRYSSIVTFTFYYIFMIVDVFLFWWWYEVVVAHSVIASGAMRM